MDTYKAAGVDTEAEETGLARLLAWVRPTEAHRPGIGRSVLPIGYFAAVLDLGDGRGLAVSTDGVGTKILIAQMAGRYDTVGIDCVAMNVNDLVCVGAEPIAMLDYLAVAHPEPAMLEAIGKGLASGARQAGISIPGGELAQIADMLAGARPGAAFDLCGTAIGLVPLSEVNVGREVAPGDVVVGIASSGLHSNGYSLARKVLLSGDSGLALDRFVPELGRTLADELLEPTAIYVDLCRRVRAAGVRPHAYLDITGDGLLNLLRVEPEVSFRIDALPEPAPIFRLIEERGRVEKAEMFRTFNMGVGFALVVAPRDADRAIALSREAGHATRVIGRVEKGPRRVDLTQHDLVGEGSDFRRG